MGAFPYLVLTKFKNGFKQFLKSPAKIIYAVFMIAMLTIVVVSGSFSGSGENIREYQDINYLIAGIFAVYTLIFYLTASSGFNTGATIFKLPDVNMLFVAPFHPRKVLMYGLLQQLGTSIFTGIFLVFQYAWLHNAFGINGLDMLVIMLGYILTVFMAQLVAMLIYTTTNQNETRRKIIKAIYYIPILLLAAAIMYQLVQTGELSFALLVEAGTGTLAKYFPVSGWLADISSAILLGDTALLITGVVLTVLAIAAIIVLLFIVEMDYYEDVLQTAEASYTSVTAAKEGRVQDAAPRKIKLGKTGFTKGSGADAFYYKHLIENRRAKAVIVPASALIFTVMCIVFSIFMKEISVIPVIAFSTYMQMFSSALGRFPRELLKPYIYLVPESSFKKILYCLKEAFPGYIAEALLLYIPVGIIIGLPVYEIAVCVLVHFSFSFLFIAGNIVTERIFGALHSKALIMMFYMLLLILLSVPGILVGIFLVGMEVILLSEVFTVVLAMSVVNLLIGLLSIFLCKNMLEYAELNN